MTPIFWFCLALAPAGPQPFWQDLTLSIEKDRYSSSDTVTLCRVRVENHGGHTWPGRSLRFEARALEGGTAVARETGRFGLSLAPHETLETLVAFLGLYDRFEVRPLSDSPPPEARKKAQRGHRRSSNKTGKRRTGNGGRRRSG
jgi:hypothetical protein